MIDINSYAEEQSALRTMLRRHEGVRHMPYLDTVGKITIGVGRNLSDRGLTQEEISLIFETDIRLAIDILDGLFPHWHAFPWPARHALISMAFNLGGPRLTKFAKMRTALEQQDFRSAAKEAKDSLWARQLPSRAAEICDMFFAAAKA